MIDRKKMMSVYTAGVSAVSGGNAVRHALTNIPAGEWFLVAVGKAAASMALGALDVLGDRITAGLLVSKYGHFDDRLINDSRYTCIESAHPVPDENSLVAGLKVKQFVSKIPAHGKLLFLTSGGASSLVEVLPTGMTLEDLQRVNRFLLGSGLDINVMNVIRKSLSGIKGGRLATDVKCHYTLQLLISDVPGDSLSSIGSGMLAPPATPQSNEAILSTMPDPLPQWLLDLQNQNVDPPAADSAVWDSIDSVIVASNQIAREAVVTQSGELGLEVHLNSGELTGDVADMAQQMVATLSSPEIKAGVYVWGGETTVRLPENPGRGGRNQQLALQLSVNLNARSDLPPWQVLVCGTDGSDGPTPDAGGLLDKSTLDMGEALGLNASEFLKNADAGTYLSATNSLVSTGPTGTNVMDLAIVILG